MEDLIKKKLEESKELWLSKQAQVQQTESTNEQVGNTQKEEEAKPTEEAKTAPSTTTPEAKTKSLPEYLKDIRSILDKIKNETEKSKAKTKEPKSAASSDTPAPPASAPAVSPPAVSQPGAEPAAAWRRQHLCRQQWRGVWRRCVAVGG